MPNLAQVLDGVVALDTRSIPRERHPGQNPGKARPDRVMALQLAADLMEILRMPADVFARIHRRSNFRQKSLKGTPKNPLRSILIPQRRVFRLPADRMLHNRLSKSVSGPSGPG